MTGKKHGRGTPSRYQREMDAFERRLIGEVLRAAGGSLSAAARDLGITHRMVRYRVEQLELRAASDPPPSAHQQKLDDAERRLIHRTLREHGTVQAAADALGLPLESLQYRVDCLNVRLDDAANRDLKRLVAPPGPRPKQ